MKIFQVVPYYPPHIGGMEYYVQWLSIELAKRGHDVTVFTTSNNSEQTIKLQPNGVKIVSLKKALKIYNIPIVPSLFWTLLNEEKPAVIHVHQYPVYFSDVSSLVCNLRNIPLIIHVHVISDAKSVSSGFLSGLYYKTLGLRTLKSANMIVVPSNDYRAKLYNMHIAAEKLKVIPCGLRLSDVADKTEMFRQQYSCEHSKIILAVGRLNYQKGFQYLIKAMPQIIKRVPSAKLVIVGEGELSAYLKGLAEKIGLTDVVVFTGVIDSSMITSAYSAADIFVLPSIFESFGMTLIEAQAAGKPVIATDVGGVPEVLVNGQTGILVEPKNIEQLEKAVVTLLTNTQLAEEMGAKGRRFVLENFASDKIVNSILEIYQKFVN